MATQDDEAFLRKYGNYRPVPTNVPITAIRPILGGETPEEEAARRAEEERRAAEEERKRRGEMRETEEAAYKAAEEERKKAQFGRQMQDLTEGQSKALDFYQRARSSQIELERLNLGPDDLIALATQEVLPANLANRFSDADRRLYRTYLKNFAMATLRRESGAAITPEEITSQISIFFPGAGADATEIQSLKRQRDLSILGLGSAAGTYGLEQANKNLQQLGYVDAEGNPLDEAGNVLAPIAEKPPVQIEKPPVQIAREGEAFLTSADLELQSKLSEAWARGATLEELNAIAAPYNHTIPLASQAELDAARAEGRGIEVTPIGRDPRDEMGFFEGIAETVTGTERSTPEIEALPDWTEMPAPGLAGFMAALSTFMTDPQETAQVIVNQFPGTTVRQDAKGNYILRSSVDGKEYAIKPGFRTGDIPRAAGSILAFTPAGRTATIAGAAKGAAATQAGIEAIEYTAGGEFNPETVALAGAGGGGGKALEEFIPVAVRAVRGRLPGGGAGPTPPAPPTGGPELPPVGGMAPEAPPAGGVPPVSVTPEARVFEAGEVVGGRGTGGAMATEEATIRAQRAAELPVPIELARFQRTRNFVEQQRARELAKNNEVGGPIRDRMAQQQEALRQNFERFIEGTGSQVWENPYEQGGVIADALGTLAKRERTKIKALYKRAEKAGEMREPVPYDELMNFINGQTATTRERLAPVLRAVDEQIKANDPNGTKFMTLNQMEDIRKLINKVASPGTPDASFGRDMRGIIDDITKDAGGDVYQQARQARAKYANDFENIDLVQKIFDNKPGTTERYVALEKVVDRIIGESAPLDSVNSLLSLLDRAGPRGERAKRELQGAVMEKIRDQAYRGVTRDESGGVVIQPAALNTIVNRLERSGKIDAIFDKKTAELLRTINDVTADIVTAPPGSVNASGTSSAIMNAIDTVATFGTTGIPVPAAKILNEFRKALATRQLRKEVKRLLD